MIFYAAILARFFNLAHKTIRRTTEKLDYHHLSFCCERWVPLDLSIRSSWSRRSSAVSFSLISTTGFRHGSHFFGGRPRVLGLGNSIPQVEHVMVSGNIVFATVVLLGTDVLEAWALHVVAFSTTRYPLWDVGVPMVTTGAVRHSERYLVHFLSLR